MKKKDQIGVGEVLIPVPEGTSTVEALLAVQQAVSQAESTIQGTNIALLKIRALLLSNYPEVSFFTSSFVCRHAGPYSISFMIKF